MLSFPPATEMFQFAGFASYALYIQAQMAFRPGCPIRRSQDHSSVTNSPGLIASSYVLHRLLTPRHSPCALIDLIMPTRPRLIVNRPFGQFILRLDRGTPRRTGSFPRRRPNAFSTAKHGHEFVGSHIRRSRFNLGLRCPDNQNSTGITIRESRHQDSRHVSPLVKEPTVDETKRLSTRPRD